MASHLRAILVLFCFHPGSQLSLQVPRRKPEKPGMPEEPEEEEPKEPEDEVNPDEALMV